MIVNLRYLSILLSARVSPDWVEYAWRLLKDDDARRNPRRPFLTVVRASECQTCDELTGIRILAVGPFAICEDCVAELERVFA